MKQKQSPCSFADVLLSRRKVKTTFFQQIDTIINWDELRVIIESAYKSGQKSTGRPSYDAIVLFKMQLLATWYNLSDGEVEDQVNDRYSFSHFVGLHAEDPVPDSTTLCRFRNTLVKAGVHDRILVEINRQLEAAGVIVRRGAIVDASITDSPRRPRGKKVYEVVEDRKEDARGEVPSEEPALREMVKPNVDTDARWVIKMKRLHFGYKRHTVTDENGLVLAEETTPANESDTRHLEAPLAKAALPEGTLVYADKGYTSEANSRMLELRHLGNKIMHRGTRKHPISDEERRENDEISRIRYRVERTFGSMRRWFGGGIARYVGLGKTHAQHIMEAMAYNLYRTPGVIVSLRAE